MDFLGIGPLELLFIVLIAFLILGPKELEKTGKSIGQGLNKLLKSDTWKTVRQASDRIKSLPNELMREAGIDEIKQSLDTAPNQPGKKSPKSIDFPEGEPWIASPAEPKKDAADNPSGGTNKIGPPDRDKPGSK